MKVVQWYITMMHPCHLLLINLIVVDILHQVVVNWSPIKGTDIGLNIIFSLTESVGLNKLWR